MNLLALDTSSDACSVALSWNGKVSKRHVVEARAHTRILLPMIQELRQTAGIDFADLDAVALGNGPGSFIGMRIGAGVAQGICYAAGLPLVPVSSLAAVAAEVFDRGPAERVVVAQDARMGEIYAGRYCRSHDGLPIVVGREEILAAGPIDWPDESCEYAGAAWRKLPAMRAADDPPEVSVELPNAVYVLALGARALREDGAIAPEALEPAYLRNTVAQIPR